MALTLTKYTGPHNIGSRTETCYIVACDNSYPTGGYALKPSSLGFSNNAPDLIIEIDNGYGYGWRYDYTNQKLMAYASAGTQVTNATDLSAVTDLRVHTSSKYTV